MWSATREQRPGGGHPHGRTSSPVVTAIWAAVEPRLPEVADDHPLGCHRSRRATSDASKQSCSGSSRAARGCCRSAQERLGDNAATTTRRIVGRRPLWAPRPPLNASVARSGGVVNAHQPRRAVVREVVPRPVEQDIGAVAEPHQRDDVHPEPGQPAEKAETRSPFGNSATASWRPMVAIDPLSR